MKDKSEHIIKRLMNQSHLVKPGAKMFLILHTGDDGLVPPPLSDDDSDSGEGIGGAHALGPFETADEAMQWEELADTVHPCGCRKVLIEVTVPRILGIVGPPMVPIDEDNMMEIMDQHQHRKDRLN